VISDSKGLVVRIFPALFFLSFLVIFTQPVLPASVQNQPSVQSQADKQTQVVQFDQDLGVTGAVELKETKAEFTTTFPFPHQWKPLPGSVLVLRLAHSSALQAKSSNLTVELNDAPVKVIALDNSNVGPADVVLPIDPAAIKNFNQLHLKVAQHYTTEDCEDQYSTALWTKIYPQTHFLLQYEKQPLTLNLQNWPYPILDLRQPGKSKVVFAPHAKASAETLQASLSIAQALGVLADYRPFELIREDPSYPQIVVGTAAENPEIATLAANGPLPCVNGRFLDFDQKPLDDDKGVLRLIAPQKGQHGVVLLVTGNGPQGVAKAAQALISVQFQPLPGGNAAIVDKLTESPPQADQLAGIPGRMPATSTFTLADLGYKTTTVRGTNPPPIEVDANTLPGIKVLGHRQKMRVVFGYGAQINPELSSFEVRLNGISLRSYPLSHIEGEEHHEDVLEIANHLVHSNNKLEFAFHLYPQKTGRCEPKIDTQLWATLYETTQLNIDHDNIAGLPDLSLLKESGAPFTNDPTLKDVTFALPSDAKPAEIFEALRLACQLGRWTKTVSTSISACYCDSVPAQARNSNHLIVLASGPNNALLNELEKNLSLVNRTRLVKLFSSSKGGSLDLRELEPNGFLEEIVSPFASGKTILVLYGNTPEALDLAVDLLIDPTLRYELKGSLASLSPELVIKTVQSTPIVFLGNTSPWRLALILLSENTWLAPLLIILLLLLLAYRLLVFLRAGKKLPDSSK
jgi:cellulose synthase operon protein B